jgi:hypothetical protein
MAKPKRYPPARQQASPDQTLKELWPGQSIALLKALHILTPNGGLNADSRRKLKQVLHLVRMVTPALDWAFKEKEEPILADLGAGKSYLGFVLYDLVFAPKGRGTVYAVESRRDLIESSKRVALESGFDRIHFIESAIRAAQVPGGKVDVVTALHACDTATDEAILFALKHEAKFIALVPCCQAEVARRLEQTQGPMRQLWRHPIQRREFGAHLTNVYRGLFLESHGYKVRVTDLTGLEHSLKNEFLFAERHQRSNAMAKAELEKLVDQFGPMPTLLANSESAAPL